MASKIVAWIAFFYSFGCWADSRGWISENVAMSESPVFSSPGEACHWYFSTKLGETYLFSHVSSSVQTSTGPFTRPPGAFFCFGFLKTGDGQTYPLGNVGYQGPLADVQSLDETYFNSHAQISDSTQEVLRSVLKRYYGPQVDQWNMNEKVLKVFHKWAGKISDQCKAFKFIPKPQFSPVTSLQGIALMLAKYGVQIARETASEGTEANQACMSAAALGMKSEFWEAGNL